MEDRAVTSAEKMLDTIIVAMERELSPEVIDKLMVAYDKVLAADAGQKFARAFVAVQREVPAIQKTALNKQTNSWYALLEDVIDQVMPIVTANGFGVTFGTAESTLEEHYRVVATLVHSDGHSKEYQADIPIDAAGIKGTPNKTKTHAFGSTMQYARRYLMALIWNLAFERDDDGNGAGGGAGEERVKQKTNEPAPTKKPYPGEKIAANKEKWRQLIAAGRDPNKIIETIQAGFTLTNEQRAAILALKGDAK